jgi:hypothetical protein
MEDIKQHLSRANHDGTHPPARRRRRLEEFLGGRDNTPLADEVDVIRLNEIGK